MKKKNEYKKKERIEIKNEKMRKELNTLKEDTKGFQNL